MKRIFVYLPIFIILTISSCQNFEENDPVVVKSREEELKNDVAKYPDSLILHETLIQYYRENGNYKVALDETNKALKRDSINPRLYDIMAVLHFENGDTASAIKAFENAIRIYPSPEYLKPLGTIYAQTRDDRALRVADILMNVDKGKSEKEALFIKGLYYNFTGNKPLAIEYFDKCLSISYTFMDAYREKAIALYDLGRYQDALFTLDKAVTLQNLFDEGHYYRGRALEKLNRLPEAIDAYQQALRLDTNYIEAKEALDRLGVKK